MDCVVSNTVLGEKHDILPERRMKKGKLKMQKSDMIGDYAKEKSTVRYSFKIFNFTFYIPNDDGADAPRSYEGTLLLKQAFLLH